MAEDDVHQSCFASTILSENGQHFAGRHFKAYVAVGFQRTEAFTDVGNFKKRRHQNLSRCKQGDYSPPAHNNPTIKTWILVRYR